MAAEKICVVVNPGAGSVEESESFLASLRKQLPEARVLRADAETSVATLARQAVEKGCELLVAAGGDGTLHDVVNAIAGRFGETRLGLLPLGTANDFARSIGLSGTLDDALGALRRGRTARIDVIRISGRHVRHSINVSSGGFAAKVNENLTSEVKERWGPLCYVRTLVGSLPQLEDYSTLLVLDDAEQLVIPAYNIVIANGRFVAGGIPIAPRARLNDGLADVIILPVKSVPQLALLASATLLGKHIESEHLIFRRARKIRVESQPPMRFNADGELLEAEPLTFEVLPSAIEFVIGELPAD